MGKLKSITLLSSVSGWYLALSTLFYYSAVYDGLELVGYICFYGAPLVYILVHYQDALSLLRLCFRNRLKYYLVAVLLMALFSIILPFVSGTNDYSYFTIRILQIAKESIKLLFLVMLFIRYISPQGDIKLFMRYFVYSTCIYILGTMIIICIPSLRELLLTLNKADANVIRLAHKATYVTRFGWCGFSGFTYTLKCSLAVMMMCFFMYEERFKLRAVVFLHAWKFILRTCRNYRKRNFFPDFIDRLLAKRAKAGISPVGDDRQRCVCDCRIGNLFASCARLAVLGFSKLRQFIYDRQYGNNILRLFGKNVFCTGMENASVR